MCVCVCVCAREIEREREREREREKEGERKTAQRMLTQTLLQEVSERKSRVSHVSQVLSCRLGVRGVTTMIDARISMPPQGPGPAPRLPVPQAPSKNF